MNEVETLSRDVEVNDIRPLICELRGHAVMLDRDLAAIYQVMTGRLNEAVKRNLARFPPEFMFQLSETEMRELIANCDRFKMMKHSPSRMYAFTEQGVRGAMRQVHEDRLRNLPRPLHHRRSEGNLLDGGLAEGRGTADLRRRENGCGGRSRASRIDPQGDIGTAGIRQRGSEWCVKWA